MFHGLTKLLGIPERRCSEIYLRSSWGRVSQIDLLYSVLVFVQKSGFGVHLLSPATSKARICSQEHAFPTPLRVYEIRIHLSSPAVVVCPVSVKSWRSP